MPLTWRLMTVEPKLAEGSDCQAYRLADAGKRYQGRACSAIFDLALFTRIFGAGAQWRKTG